MRAWAKSRMSSAGSAVTLEAFAFSYARSSLKGLDSQRAFLLYVGRRSRFGNGSPSGTPGAGTSSASAASSGSKPAAAPPPKQAAGGASSAYSVPQYGAGPTARKAPVNYDAYGSYYSEPSASADAGSGFGGGKAAFWEAASGAFGAGSQPATPRMQAPVRLRLGCVFCAHVVCVVRVCMRMCACACVCVCVCVLGQQGM